MLVAPDRVHVVNDVVLQVILQARDRYLLLVDRFPLLRHVPGELVEDACLPLQASHQLAAFAVGALVGVLHSLAPNARGLLGIVALAEAEETLDALHGALHRIDSPTEDGDAIPEVAVLGEGGFLVDCGLHAAAHASRLVRVEADVLSQIAYDLALLEHGALEIGEHEQVTPHRHDAVEPVEESVVQQCALKNPVVAHDPLVVDLVWRGHLLRDQHHGSHAMQPLVHAVLPLQLVE